MSKLISVTVLVEVVDENVALEAGQRNAKRWEYDRPETVEDAILYLVEMRTIDRDLELSDVGLDLISLKVAGSFTIPRATAT